MLSDCPETTKNILDIIYGDEGEGNGISTISQTAYFIFFIFKLLCVHKDEKQNFLYMYRNEKQ